MADDQGAPKLHIDSDWKAEAQREKQRLAEKEATAAKSTAGGSAPGSAKGSGAAAAEQGELPEASFRSLVSMLASQAVMGLGAMADQQTGRVIIDLEGSRFAIDLLDVLEQKTKGNLTSEESKELTMILAELRNRYVQIVQLVNRQMEAQANAGAVAGQIGVAGAAGAAATTKAGVPPLKMP